MLVFRVIKAAIYTTAHMPTIYTDESVSANHLAANFLHFDVLCKTAIYERINIGNRVFRRGVN
jgi:hypothetical protein